MNRLQKQGAPGTSLIFVRNAGGQQTLPYSPTVLYSKNTMGSQALGATPPFRGQKGHSKALFEAN